MKTLLNFGCINGSWSLNRSPILKLEKFSDLHSKIWGNRFGVWKCDSSYLWL